MLHNGYLVTLGIAFSTYETLNDCKRTIPTMPFSIFIFLNLKFVLECLSFSYDFDWQHVNFN